MNAPVNLLLESPTVTYGDWEAEAERWLTLNRSANGNPDFYPTTVKAAYVIGVVHDICTSVSCLLSRRSTLQATYLPALGVCASGIEILGRCILGVQNTRQNSRALQTGFRWLRSSDHTSVSDEQPFITTNSRTYDINTLVDLRHFAAHGQATSRPDSAIRQFPDIDFNMLEHLPPLIGEGLDRWWNKLRESEELCNKLIQANILAFRSPPLFNMWDRFERDANGKYWSITEIFTSDFDWRVT